MGHERIGFIPKTKQWRSIITQLQNYYGDEKAVSKIAADTLDALKGLYLVDKNVFHGASGGIVLDKNDQIIGLICAGIASMDLPANNSKQGFIPINTVLQDIEQQGF